MQIILNNYGQENTPIQVKDVLNGDPRLHKPFCLLMLLAKWRWSIGTGQPIIQIQGGRLKSTGWTARLADGSVAIPNNPS